MTGKESSIDRRQVLRSLGAAAAMAAAATPARAAAQVSELIVLTAVTPWLPAYQKVAARYEAESGVKITLRPFPYGGLRTQMTNAIQAKNPAFDVYQLDEPWTGQFYDNGWVRPIDDIIPGFKLDPGIVPYDGLPFWDKTRRSSSLTGQVMGLPINGNVDLFVYRKDLYEKLGMTPPRTWDEALDNGRRAQKANVVKYGYVTRGQPTTGGQAISYEFMPVFYSYGANWFAEEGRDWTPTVASRAAQAGAGVFRNLLELGPTRSQTVGQADVIALIQGGQALQGHFVAAAASQLEDSSRSSVVGKCGYTVLPAGASGRPAPTSGAWSLCVPADQADERQKAAADFLVWMLKREQQAAFAQAGGIPTRNDVAGSFGAAASYLQAVAESAPFIRRAIRYVFAAPMLDIVEPTLGQIGSGDLPIAQGLDRLQAQLAQIVRAAGFAG